MRTFGVLVACLLLVAQNSPALGADELAGRLADLAGNSASKIIAADSICRQAAERFISVIKSN